MIPTITQAQLDFIKGVGDDEEVPTLEWHQATGLMAAMLHITHLSLQMTDTDWTIWVWRMALAHGSLETSST